MNWEAIGAISEVVGAIVVVVSLIYLATQVKVSNRLARAEAWRGPNSDLNSLNAAFSVERVFRDAVSKVLFGDAGRADLEDDECVILDWYIVSVLNIYEQIYREIREGTLKENAISDFAGRSFFDRRYFRSSWGMYKKSLGTSFVSYFEANLISEQPSDDIGQVTAVQHERSE